MKSDTDDWTVLGFDGTGNVRHVTHASRECAVRTARYLRSLRGRYGKYYASVRVVTYDEAMSIIKREV